ncbi:unnamed protein product [Closterium sp. NIES-54]
MLLALEGDPDAPDIPTPRSYVEAITGPSSSQWQAAMDAKMASWKSTGTYVDEVPPPGANIRDYELHSLDFSTALLQGSLREEIWLRRPPGFTGTFLVGTQWSLRRPVYGLHQAPLEWHDTLRTALAALGFAPSTADPSLFLRTDTSLPPFYVLVYVDDLVFATADTEALTLVKSELQKRHTCTNMGELRSYLGLQITWDRARRTITLTQSHMVHQVLQRFGFLFSSPQPTPMSTNHWLSAPPSDESVEPSGPYPELVGCLMYLMTCTQPDLAYPLSILACYLAPGRHQKVHWDATKRVLRYLCSTLGMGLVLGGQGPVVLTGHADASWADDSATQRSSQGYTFSLGSSSVSWRSTRSSSIFSFSCEAEIYAGAMAAQELRWLTYLLTDLGEQPRLPPVLSQPPLPRSLTPPFLPCVEGRQRAAPHSSSFPPTTAPLQTLHMDVRYTRYTTIFPLQSKADVRGVLIRWIRAVRLQLRARFREDLPVLQLHSDRGGEFCSFLLEDFCGAEGIVQSYTLPASPQENGIAERRIGLVMEAARTSMTGEVGDASAFRVRGSLSLVRDLPAGKLSPRTLQCVFLGFPTDAPPWQFYHTGSRRVLSSRDVTFDESVFFYRLHPHRNSAVPLPPLSLVDPPPLVEPLEVSSDTSGPAEGGDQTATHTVAPRRSARLALTPGFPPRPSSPLLRPVAMDSGAAGGGTTGGAGSGGTSAGGTGATGGTGGAAAVGAAVGSPSSHRQEPLSPERLHEWAVRWGSPGGGVGGAGSGGAFPVAGTTPLLFPPTDQSQPQLLLGSPLPAPAPHTEVTESLTERREPETRACTHVHGRRVVCPRAPTVPGTLRMALHPSSIPQRVVLPSPPVSSLPHVPDPESDLVHTASPTVTRLLATVVTDPSFESAATSALVADLVDFSALCRFDYAASLVFDSSCPPSIRGELALGCDVLEDRQFELECLAGAAPHLASTLLCPEGDPDALDIPTSRTYAEAITRPYSSQWQIAMDGEMASWKSTGTYVDAVPPHSFRQREGVNFFQTFFPTPKIRVLLHVAAQRDYELHSLDFSMAFLQGSLHEAIWLRCPRGFTGSFPEGTQSSLRRPVYDLRQAPRDWHDTLRTTLAALGFAPSTADPSLNLRTDTSLPPFYVLVYVHDLVFATADTEALALVKAELKERHTCTDLGELRSYLGLQITRDRARHTITLTLSHMMQQVFQRFDFSWSSL